ncbi:hypothetical protein F5890DRAFT_14150 [Lentinula detonsa]|uniref:Uncharacterized protein n=1 Tax=Lentinula detonsa TaxID=2804962 RepID=A0AA38QAT0_9AGAR|nr:hypothetical protein F5890DRAFT_14150 [Lentinula detonsa]
MHSPTNQDDVGYSPARIRPAKRQRMRSSSVNDLSRSFVRPSVKIVTSKLFAASPSQTSSISIQDQTRKRNSFQESANSNSSTLNSPSRTCLPFAIIPFESFPRFDLRHALSLNQPPLRQKNRTPLRIRLKTGNKSDSSAFTLFWDRATKRSAVQRVSSKEEEPQIASTLYIAVSSLPGFAHCTTGSCPSPDFPTTFLPGKIHLGKKFCTEKRATTT